MAFEYALTAAETARLDSAVALLIDAAKAESLIVTRDQLEDLDTVRMAVLTDLPLESARAMEQVRKLVPDQIRQRDLRAALADAQSTAAKDVAKLSASARMTLGHELLADQKAADSLTPKNQMSASQESEALAMIANIAHGPTRLAVARKMGLC